MAVARNFVLLSMLLAALPALTVGAGEAVEPGATSVGVGPRASGPRAPATGRVAASVTSASGAATRSPLAAAGAGQSQLAARVLTPRGAR